MRLILTNVAAASLVAVALATTLHAQTTPKPPMFPPREKPMTAQVPPAMVSIAKGDMSGVEMARQVTVRTAAEWQKLWKEHSPDEKMPAVDFSTKMIVGVFLGSKPSDGYSVEILNVRTEGADLVVEYAQKQPGRGVMAAQILTEPYHLVAVPQRAGNVRFLHVPDTRQ